MADSLRCVRPESVVTGWDFSTGAVKCLAFDLDGKVLAQVRMPTDLWFGTPDEMRQTDEPHPSELNLMQLEGQARASVRAMAARLRGLGRIRDWVTGGISATHHTAGRIDRDRNQVRRAVCWNDHTLARYHKKGLKRLGGQQHVQELIGGPWAIRYTLSHLVKDELCLPAADWQRTHRILPHGPLAAGYLTGNFDVISVSAAASTGIMDLRAKAWRREMLNAVQSPKIHGSPIYEELAWQQLPRIIDHYEPVGALADHVALEAGIDPSVRPLIFPTSDDQQAGLVGGGAVDDGQVAVILGNSAVVNSSSNDLPSRGSLDVMCLNWGPYLWMRCYNNGAQFLDRVVGANPDWQRLEHEARAVEAGCNGTAVLPFTAPEPSLGVDEKRVGLKWFRPDDESPGKQFRASLEALACLMKLGVEEHEKAGQRITRITVSGGIARSDLMCEILASVLGRRLERLASDEGPALGAAVTALAAYETHLRRQRKIRAPFNVADAVGVLVKFRDPVEPNPDWVGKYAKQVEGFRERLGKLQKKNK
ncbi:MAG: xylulose kinase [Pirellulales bacterium]|nr:xylulose kinase [Pirellulales bacterium]